MTCSIAVLGCGGIASAHCKILSETKQANLKAFFDIRREQAEKLSALYPGSYAAHSITDIIQDKKIDAVYFCMGHSWTLQYLTLFQQTGKSFFIEKPLAANEKDLIKMSRIIKKNKLRVFAGFKTRYNSAVREMKKIIPVPHHLSAQVNDAHWRGHHYDSVNEGTHILCQGVYASDAICYLAGSLPVSVFACGPRRPDANFPASLSAIIEFKNGSAGTLIIDENGVQPELSKFFIQSSGGGKILSLSQRYTRLTVSDGEGVREMAFSEDGFKLENMHFLEASAAGGDYETGFIQGALPSIVLYRAIESWKKGKPVKITSGVI